MVVVPMAYVKIAVVTYLFAGIPTADFESALDWYGRFLGRAPDRFPNDREAVWQLTDTGLIYLIVDAARAGNALVTLIVSDLDGWLNDVSARGIDVGAIEAMPGIARKTAIVDPDGNTISIGQLLGSGD